MRLQRSEISNLKNSIFLFDKNAKIYLFGSRVDEQKRGGDIDILVISDILNEKNRRKIRRNFFQEFGEQKLDIIIENQKKISLFGREILEKAIEI
ncbi:nucleotidyltransferase family protein [Thiovulum sp. ES]|nr:nucleotidyltransferase family protein [Thiovulum sp. ES]